MEVLLNRSVVKQRDQELLRAPNEHLTLDGSIEPTSKFLLELESILQDKQSGKMLKIFDIARSAISISYPKIGRICESLAGIIPTNSKSKSKNMLVLTASYDDNQALDLVWSKDPIDMQKLKTMYQFEQKNNVIYKPAHDKDSFCKAIDETC